MTYITIFIYVIDSDSFSKLYLEWLKEDRRLLFNSMEISYISNGIPSQSFCLSLSLPHSLSFECKKNDFYK